MRTQLLFLLYFCLVCCISGCGYADENAENSETGPREKSCSVEEFALNWYQKCAQRNPEENLILSPLATYRMLGALYLGSEKQTAEQIRKGMCWSGDREMWIKSMNQISRQFLDTKEVEMADGIWIQEKYSIQGAFAGMLRDMGNAEVQNVDFTEEQTRDKINFWIKEKTAEKIPELLKELSSDARLVLTNTLTFQGNWKEAFDKQNTRSGYFTSLKGEEVRFPLMQREGDYRYLRQEDFQWMEMPYEGERFMMAIFLPKSYDMFFALEKRLTPELLRECREKSEKTHLDVRIPRFVLSQDFQAVPVLKELGIVDAFQSTADFSGITGANDLMVSSIIQGNFLRVDEKGTQAAAATAAEFLPKSAPVNDIPRFYADRPFVFVIYDVKTEMILFCGRFVDPEGMKKMAAEFPEEIAIIESSGNNPDEESSVPIMPNSAKEIIVETVHSNLNTSGVGGTME
ncbi:MAG: serpin family protein [Planctomycetia bacterium]|nr:serpin family protein [Planctomycetia bacterium]